MLYHVQSPFFAQFLASPSTKYINNDLGSTSRTLKKPTKPPSTTAEEVSIQVQWDYDVAIHLNSLSKINISISIWQQLLYGLHYFKIIFNKYMIVKTLGKKLIIDTKLHLLVHKISPILIIVSIVLFLNMASNHQKNKFQEPTLRTKIYDPIDSPAIIDPVFKKDSGVIIHNVEGLVDGQCLMISFIKNSYSKKIISLISDNLKNDKVLSKTVLFVGY